MRRVLESLPVPTGRFCAAAALLAVVALALPAPPVPTLLILNTLLAGLAVADSRIAPAPASLSVSRRFPEVVAMGQRSEIRWQVENQTGRAVTVELADELAPSLQPERRRIRAVLPDSSATTVTTAITPSRRGRFVMEDIAIRVMGPLGLGSRQATVSRRHVLRVYPSFGSRAEAELRINRARVLEVGLRSAKALGGGTDFDALREYGPDDEFRRIDWAATARTGKAIVRTYRAERNQSVLALLDTGRTMAGRVAGAPRLEHAMDAVMAITTVATRLGDRCGLVAFDAEVRSVVAPSHSRGQVGRVTEAMYQLEPRLVESDYAAAFTTALARFRRRSLLVVLSDLAGQAIEDTLLPALPLVVRDHLVVLAGVQDPDIAHWARARPETPDDAYRAAAAAAALEERRRLVARLQGLGVTVVDAPPGRLAPSVADAYLRVKATGRL